MGNLHKEQRAKGTGFWLRVIGYGVRVAGRMAHDSRPTQLRPTGRDMPRPYIPLPTLPIPHPTHHAYVFFSHPAQPAYRMAQGSWLTATPPLPTPNFLLPAILFPYERRIIIQRITKNPCRACASVIYRCACACHSSEHNPQARNGGKPSSPRRRRNRVPGA